MATKYPHARVELSGTDGNVFVILGKTQRALRNAGATPAEIDRFIEEATSGSYEAALAACSRWVEVV